MTESEWLDSTDPQLMLEALHHWASERKRRLFVCACFVHGHRHGFGEDEQRKVRADELYADGCSGGHLQAV